ncbi:MAG: hypothetical protein HKN31_06280 [Pricia sp.]|nr:hypothetical protein [Pricia sp.]
MNYGRNNGIRYHWTVILIFIFGILCSGKSYALFPSLSNNDSIVYVWDFTVSNGSIKEIGAMLTNDFETELINSGLYTVLERRRYNRVLAHQDLEKKIADIQNVPSASMDSLRANRAEVVIFGEVKDDIESGVYEVTVTFQNLNEVILRKGSVLIGRGLIRDNQTRKQFMKDLVDVVHAKELMAAKREQYNIISNLLETYLVRVIDVQKQFQDVTRYALENPVVEEEMTQIISDYNAIFNDLNNNKAKYQLNFSKYWTESRVLELQSIIEAILDDIHKTHILKLDKVRSQILGYGELSKSEKKRRKKEILKDVKNITDDLERQIGILNPKVNTFLSQLRNEINNEHSN